MFKNCANVGRSIFFVAAIVVWSEHCVKAEVYPSIYWTPNNPIFSKSTNELKVFLNNRIHVVCPNPSTVLTTIKGQTSIRSLYENFWNVDAAGYRTCSARNPARPSALLLLCDRPSELHYTSIVFRKYQSSPSEIAFSPGNEYFFIATSDGTKESLNSTSGGHCSTHNMKFKVYVCRDTQDSRCARSTGYDTQKRKTTAEEERVDFPSTSATIKEGISHSEVLSNSCNSSALGTEGETESLQKSKALVWPIAVLTPVAALSIALNVFLLWTKCKSHQNLQCDPSQMAMQPQSA